MIRKLLKESSNPLYFYDDDPDGLVSYLLLRKGFGKGNGIIIRVRGTSLNEEELYLRKIEEYNPDLVVFLDKPTLNQDVFDKINVKKIWIDHHDVVDVKGVYYYNPRMRNKKNNKPTSYLCYKITKKDLWLGTVGSVADWSLVLFNSFKKRYGDLVGDVKNFKNIKADDVLYNTKLGELVRIFSFILKGRTKDVKKNIEMLLKIDDPYEILNKESENGKILFEGAEKIKNKYNLFLKKAISTGKRTRGRIIAFSYIADDISFTSDLANEMIHKFPVKIIAVGRIKEEMMRISLRSSLNDVELPKIIEKIFSEMKGSGGGHEHAAAVEIHKDDYKKFINLLRKYA
ncbi:DHH family phosphoesterase [Candidatus Woesearchaeota archaeon]|nr:DHH family phosphoesterase [Candidatus Woesearchaeota archaeon]